MQRSLKLFILMLITAFVFVLFPSVSMSAEDAKLAAIKKAQQKLSYLADANPEALIFSSGYDFYYDMYLYYNPSVRNLIKSLAEAKNHCKQSNVAVAYYEYAKILKEMQPNDFYYMMIAYDLAETGFFSLAHIAMNKIEDTEIWESHINAIRKHGFPEVMLKRQEEIFFAELYSDIVYNNMTDESLVRLTGSKKVLSDSDYASYIRAKAYFAENNYKKALSEIDKALSLNKDNVIYKKHKAEIETALHNDKEALKIINSLEDYDILFITTIKNIDITKYYILSGYEKDELAKKYYLAYYFYLNRDYQRALDELTSLTGKGETKNAPKLSGYIYMITDREAEAKNVYEKWLTKDKKASYAYKGLGDLCVKNADYEQARKYYNSAYKYNKKSSEILVALSVVSAKLGDSKNAVKYADKAIKIAPTDYKALYLQSKIKPDPGRTNLKKALRYNPFYPDGWLDLAQTAYASKDIVSAQKYVNIAAFITKKDPRYFYFKSLVNTELNDTDTAERDIARASELVEMRKLTGVKTDDKI